MKHLWRHPNGYWYLKDGNWRRSLLTKDPVVARRMLEDIKRKSLENELKGIAGSESITLSEFRKRYMDTRASKSPSTLRADNLAFGKLESSLGPEIRIAKITRESAEHFISQCVKETSQGAANVWHRHLKAAFSKAVEWDLIGKNPFAFKVAKHQPAPAVIVTPEIRRAIFEAIPDPDFRRMVAVYLMTGLRRHELVNAKWADIRQGELIVKGKGGKYRVVPLLKPVLNMLGKPGKPEAYLFPRWRDPNVVSRMFRYYADKAGYHDVKLHHLRHTVASLMAEKHYSLAAMMALLGHSTAAMTLHYQQSSRDEIRKAAGELVEDVIKDAG